jgi:hypothetical protein
MDIIDTTLKANSRNIAGMGIRTEPGAWDWTSFTIDGANHDLDVSSIVPAGAKWVLFQYELTNTQANVYFGLHKNGGSAWFDAGLVYSQVANVPIRGQLWVQCDLNRIVEYIFQNTGSWSSTALSVVSWAF